MVAGRLLTSVALALTFWSLSLGQAYAQACGGVERWAVKMGSDPAADEIDIGNVQAITIDELNNLADSRDEISQGDNETRLAGEKQVYRVRGVLRLFKDEDDSDYHLVIADDSLNFTKGGSRSRPTGTSFIAEIPDPKCFMGKHAQISRRSIWEGRIRETRDRFELSFPGGEGADEVRNMPVTLVGVAFFDRDHGQIGRARNGFELHPVLSIDFDGAAAPTALSAPSGSGERNLFTNSGFEGGDTGWRATAGSIEVRSYPQAARGDGRAVLGNLGERGETFLSQSATIPATAQSVKLTYRLRVRSDEPAGVKTETDKLFVQVRDANGKYLKTLRKHTNLDRSRSYKSYEIDLAKYKNRTIQVYFKSTEDKDNATAFYLDDVELRVK